MMRSTDCKDSILDWDVCQELKTFRRRPQQKTTLAESVWRNEEKVITLFWAKLVQSFIELHENLLFALVQTKKHEIIHFIREFLCPTPQKKEFHDV